MSKSKEDLEGSSQARRVHGVRAPASPQSWGMTQLRRSYRVDPEVVGHDLGWAARWDMVP